MLPSSVGFTVDDEPTVWEFQLVLYKCAIQVLRYLLLLLSFFWTPFICSVFYLLVPSLSTHHFFLLLYRERLFHGRWVTGLQGMRKLIVPVLIVLGGPFLIISTPVNLLLGVVHNLPSLFVAIFLIYARKANFDINIFLNEFENVGQQQKTVVSISVMAAFLARVFYLDKNEEEDFLDLRPFLLQTAAALITVGLFDILK